MHTVFFDSPVRDDAEGEFVFQPPAAVLSAY